MRRHTSMPAAGAMTTWLLLAGGLCAQHVATLVVEETAGIRRTQFPARAVVEVEPGRLAAATSIRLTDRDELLPAQGFAATTWDDGSVRSLEVDFNLSIGPFEARSLRLEYGAASAPAQGPRRGLTVERIGNEVQVGRVRFGVDGNPLLVGVGYREQLVVEGRNGVAVYDVEGKRYGAETVSWQPVVVVEEGPVTARLRYAGVLRLEAGERVEIVVDVEMPDSKSWVKISATAIDPDRGVREIALETPLRMGPYPWTWDVGTRNGTYGAIRGPDASVVFTQRVGEGGDGSWTVRTGARGQVRPYESSPEDAAEVARAWAHLVSEREAVAFAVEGIGETPGTFMMTLDGTGQTSFSFAPTTSSTQHSIRVYQHYVSTPVPIGAATSPASILSPLRVTVQ